MRPVTGFQFMEQLAISQSEDPFDSRAAYQWLSAIREDDRIGRRLGQIENASQKSISKVKALKRDISNMVLIRNSNFYDKITGFRFSIV